MRTLKILTGLILFSAVFALKSDAQETEYVLKINLHERQLTLYARAGAEERKISSYAIAVPLYEKYLPLPLKGEVRKITLKPWWRPTSGTREAYLRKKGMELPAVIKPGDPLNAMGAAKIEMEFKNGFGAPIRIHGTNDPDSIGQPISRGCIRLHNEDILSIIAVIKGTRTQVFIESE